MPLQEFWNDDPDLLWVYRNLYIQKIEEEAKLQKEIMNASAWLQGLYVHKAIKSAFSRDEKYPEQPIELEDKPKDRYEKNKRVENKIKQQLLNAQIILKERIVNKG